MFLKFFFQEIILFKLKCDRRLSPNNNLLTMWNHDFVNINMYSCDDIVVKQESSMITAI